MIYNYYPGCTLSTKAKQLDMAARRCAEVLGFPLVELPEWQCCGAVYPMAPDAIAERLSAVRALVAARENGGVLVTLCSACYHVIKRVNHDMATNAEIRQKVNNYLQLEEPYAGETRVLHYLEVLRDEIGWEKLAQLVNSAVAISLPGIFQGLARVAFLDLLVGFPGDKRRPIGQINRGVKILFHRNRCFP